MKPLMRICLLVLCVLLSGLVAQAQGLPATVGVPFSFDLLQGSGASLSFTFEGYVVNFSFQGTAGTLPPGLTFSPTGVISGIPTTPGTYNVASSLVVTVTPNLPNYPMSYPEPVIPITVKGGTGPALTAGGRGRAGYVHSRSSVYLSLRDECASNRQVPAADFRFLCAEALGRCAVYHAAFHHDVELVRHYFRQTHVLLDQQHGDTFAW